MMWELVLFLSGTGVGAAAMFLWLIIFGGDDDED